jgi:glycosyltransferase involved in cell wall biosynthesis
MIHQDEEGLFMTLRLAMLSTYPPTQCGIATFARSLAGSMARTGPEVSIIDVRRNTYENSNPIVVAAHRSNRDLQRTAHVVNSHDVAIIQHEFGIYGGRDGSEVLNVLGELTVPVITVLHTVVEQPTVSQQRVMQGLLNGSDRVITLSKSALRALLRNYEVDLTRTHVVPHGAPRLNGIPRPHSTRMRPRILTWGLLGQGKGIEWGIEALAALSDVDPAPDYFVVGQTHPKIKAVEGTRYRDELERLARRRGVGDRVHFIDGYLDDHALAQLIISADIFLLPYDSRDQVTSGVLAEAMVAGGPVIATRFPHAVELLGDGTGILVDHQNPDSIAGALRRIIRQPDLHGRLRLLTEQKATSFLWSSVGMTFSRLAHDVWRNRAHEQVAVAPVSLRAREVIALTA